MSSSKDTIAAIATPPGRGSLGIIRISGDKCQAICRAVAGKTPVPRQAEYVSFNTANGEKIDNGIVIYFQSPSSYTGEDVLECHLHGSRFVLSLLLEEIFLHGARPALPGEFTERAFLNDKIDLIQAEAVADLIDSSSIKAARSAMRSLDGEFSREVISLKNQILEARTFIEAALDFPDEDDVDIDFAPAFNKVKQSLALINNLLSRAKAGQALDQCPSVVIVGSPNVGKSSIINILSGNDVAIVSAVPGTTRDIIKESVILDGSAFTLIDTAGIRESKDNIEQEGMNRTYKSLSAADLVLQVFDANEKPEKACLDIDNYLSNKVRILNIHNKIDLSKNNKFKNTEHDIYISAKTGEGVSGMIKKICASLDNSSNEENLVFARQRHIDALSKVKESLHDCAISLNNNTETEILAEQLRRALTGFDEITGKITSDDVLGEIFSQFCIGK